MCNFSLFPTWLVLPCDSLKSHYMKILFLLRTFFRCVRPSSGILTGLYTIFGICHHPRTIYAGFVVVRHRRCPCLHALNRNVFAMQCMYMWLAQCVSTRRLHAHTLTQEPRECLITSNKFIKTLLHWTRCAVLCGTAWVSFLVICVEAIAYFIVAIIVVVRPLRRPEYFFFLLFSLQQMRQKWFVYAGYICSVYTDRHTHTHYRKRERLGLSMYVSMYKRLFHVWNQRALK